MHRLEADFLEHALSVARTAADAAERVIARHYGRELTVETKRDHSPVTQADRDSEREIRRVLQSAFPTHGYYGEELGRDAGEQEFLWLIDPIDGTKSFVRGYPMFSTQIALMHRGELVLGVSSAGQYGEVAWARRGGGAFLNGVRVQVGSVSRVESASLSFGNLKSLASDERWLKLASLVRHAWRVRGYGDFCHYHLLARGAVDAVIESDVNILDIAPLVVLVREAGGVFTDLDGRAPGLETRSVLAAPPGLHQRLLAALHDCCAGLPPWPARRCAWRAALHRRRRRRMRSMAWHSPRRRAWHRRPRRPCARVRQCVRTASKHASIRTTCRRISTATAASTQPCSSCIARTRNAALPSCPVPVRG